MVKVDWLLVEVASLTVGGGYEAKPLDVVGGCWLLVAERRLSSRRVFW